MGPPLFCVTLIPIVSKLRIKYEPLGVRIKANMNDINLHFRAIAEDAMQVLQDLVDQLEAVGIRYDVGP